MKKYRLNGQTQAIHNEIAAAPKQIGVVPPKGVIETGDVKFATPTHKWRTFQYDFKQKGWQKLAIEAYCCGWLDYHEKKVEKNPKLKHHRIYFEWAVEENSRGKWDLVIYIDPPPKKIPQKGKQSGSTRGKKVSKSSSKRK